ncbi:MAG TPA: PRTRC system protein E [Chitinophagaceae bacterium]|jgi:PRTRC genetic system protein E|nr:PRTRC system protein E [Chitinophagaceae bacterium]
MKTNFFEILSSLQVEADWKITISKDAAGTLTVSVLLSNEKCGDDARKLVPPMLFKGTAQELDEGFFTCIKTPAEKTSQLFANMEQYLKAQETAKVQSKMEQDKKQKEAKQKETGDKKYETQMKKVTELETAGKYREAYGQLPKISDFPDHEEEITEKKNELMEKFEDTGLFAQQSQDND